MSYGGGFNVEVLLKGACSRVSYGGRFNEVLLKGACSRVSYR